MTNSQNAIVSGVKHRLNFICDREVTLTKKELQDNKDYILGWLQHFIVEYNYAKYVTEAEREIAK